MCVGVLVCKLCFVRPCNVFHFSLWRNKLSATHYTHAHKRRHLYKIHIRHVARSRQVAWPTFVTHPHRETHPHSHTRTLVAVALLNFQTHAKLNPRMCLTFALFWLSGPRVFSPLSSMLSVSVCVHSSSLCVCVCALLFSIHSSLLFSLFYYTIKPQQLETRDTRLDTAVAFPFDTLFLFTLSTLQKK